MTEVSKIVVGGGVEAVVVMTFGDEDDGGAAEELGVEGGEEGVGVGVGRVTGPEDGGLLEGGGGGEAEVGSVFGGGAEGD